MKFLSGVRVVFSMQPADGVGVNGGDDDERTKERKRNAREWRWESTGDAVSLVHRAIH